MEKENDREECAICEGTGNPLPLANDIIEGCVSLSRGCCDGCRERIYYAIAQEIIYLRAGMRT